MMKNKYIIPDSWKNATEQERKDIANGCGGSWKDKARWYARFFYWTLNKAIPDTIYGLGITDICGWHDFEFTFLEKTDLNFKKANYDFYHNLKKRCIDNSNFIMKPLRLQRCKELYWFVENHGRDYFFTD